MFEKRFVYSVKFWQNYLGLSARCIVVISWFGWSLKPVLVQCTLWIESWNKLTWTAKKLFGFLRKRKKKAQHTISIYSCQHTKYKIYLLLPFEPVVILEIQTLISISSLVFFIVLVIFIIVIIIFVILTCLSLLYLLFLQRNIKPKHILQKPKNLTTKQTD